jgi:hypothetical protein
MFMDRLALNAPNKSNDWFFINNNLRFVESMRYDMADVTYDKARLKARVDSLNAHLYRETFKISHIVFDYMIRSGTLTRMIAIPELTNKNVYDITKNEQKTKLVERITSMYFSENNNYMNGCYYYLTSTRFKDVKSYVYDDDGVEYNYIKSNSTPKYAWYLATAFEWIAQMGFCHKFIHNRVSYITGATGAGKSTQVPKLYMYYLVSLEHKLNATVLLTVPRTNVATGTSNFISKELSVPFKHYEGTKEVLTPNRTIQFKHKGSDRNLMKDGNFPKIRFITDGSVLTEMMDPMLLNKYYNGNEDINIYSRMSRQSMYDVIIVDEAHEHNPNMDLILSLMRNIAYYNNQVRLVVMSATMDADEPVYRRFYRCIDDNRKYPLNRWIAKHGIDRANMDRRFHISSPDVTTRFNIYEKYHETEELGGTDTDILEVVNTILKDNRFKPLESSDGDILIFRPGVNDINSLVKLLNDKLPPNVITLPYHSKLSEKQKKYIQKINEYLPKFRYDRTVSYDSAKHFEGTANYSRAIIVSTNIAEASITISTLRYVIETGTEKTMVFNYMSRTSDIKVNTITDASRLQRKGRVGRKSEGMVHYMYKENLMRDQKKQFTISVQDQHNKLYDLLRNANDISIVNDTVASIASGSSTWTESSIRSYITSEFGNKKRFANSLADVLVGMYCINGEYYSYKGKQTEYERPDLYFSGFDGNTLTDAEGKFYIVHYDELSIKRNINGYPVESIDTDIVDVSGNSMSSKKMRVFWDMLIDSNLCTDNGYKIDSYGYSYITKTEVGRIMTLFTRNILSFLDTRLVMVLGYLVGFHDKPFVTKSTGRGNVTILSDELFADISTLCLLDTIRNPYALFKGSAVLHRDKALTAKSPDYIPVPSKHEKNMDVRKLFKQSIKDVTSDFEILKSVTMLVDNLVDERLKTTMYEMRLNDYIDIFHAYKGGSTIDEKKMDKQINIILEIQRKYHDRILKDNNTLRMVGLDDETIIEYMNLREKILIEIICLLNGDKTQGSIEDMSDVLTKQRDIINDNKLDRFNSALLYASPYLLSRKIEGTSYHYVSGYTPEIKQIYTIRSLNKSINTPTASGKKRYVSPSYNQFQPDTFIDELYIHSYLYYHQFNRDTNTMGMLAHITSDYFDLLNIPYRLNVSDYRYNKIDLDSEKTQEDIKKFINDGIKRSFSTDFRVNEPFDYYDGYMAVVKLNDTIDTITNEISS